MSKELVAVRTIQGPWKVQFNGGGEVPKMLSGLFTKKVIAEAAIQDYITLRDEVAEAKAKAEAEFKAHVKETQKNNAKAKAAKKSTKEKDNTEDKGVEDAKVTPTEH